MLKLLAVPVRHLDVAIVLCDKHTTRVVGQALPFALLDFMPHNSDAHGCLLCAGHD
jgi:hypothetical protein